MSNFQAPQTSNDEAMFQYLLGEFPEEWRAQFEERLFTDPECFDQLLVAEDQLIEAYLRGELAEREQRSFKEYFLTSSRRREKLAMMSALLQALETPAPAPGAVHGRPRWSPVAKLLLWLGVLLFLCLCVWLLAVNNRP